MHVGVYVCVCVRPRAMQGSSFDTCAKQWRLFADVTNDIGDVCARFNVKLGVCMTLRICTDMCVCVCVCVCLCACV